MWGGGFETFTGNHDEEKDSKSELIRYEIVIY